MEYIDKGVFFIKNNKVALELYDIDHKFEKISYDGKNTIVLSTAENGEYILKNIAPDIRKLLQDKEKIMMLQNQNGEVAEIYFLTIELDKTLQFEDEYNKKSEEIFDEISNIIDSDVA